MYMRTQTNYASYLLRVWRTNSAEPPRAALTDVNTGQEVAFAALEAILPYIETYFESAVQGEENQGGSSVRHSKS